MMIPERLTDITLPDTLSETIALVNHLDHLEKKPEQSVRIHILRNFTIEGIEPFLKFYHYQSGIRPEISFGNYDNVRQELLDKKSSLYQHHPDIVVLGLVLETLDTNLRTFGWTADRVISEIESLLDTALQNTQALLAVNTFVPPWDSEWGMYRSPDAAERFEEVQRINRKIRERVRRDPTRLYLMDWERYLIRLGEEAAMDYRFWYTSKAPFKKDFMSAYAFDIAKLSRGLKGKTKKCLVLDCDNTLWGGIIGEDGVSSIKLDRDSFPGRVYRDFQLNALALYERGILLTLCSKNNEADVWEVFDHHPDMALRREHIAAWRINWTDKATNIRSLAEELNIGLDSFVFVDDSPAECELVRTMIPDVTVLQVPQKLYTYPPFVIRSGFFDALQVSSEDKNRTRMMHEESMRRVEETRYTSIDDYLASLQLYATIHEAPTDEIPRVAQLTQKTNQFNVTTRRYSEAQITAFAENPDASVWTMRAGDKFGDFGLTAVIIVTRNGDTAEVDSFLLSCRILGRKLETAFVRHVMAALTPRWNIRTWQAYYIPTKKNGQTEKFWDSFGFRPTPQADRSVKYTIDASALDTTPIPFISYRS
ncbi:MAG TPA: HAD-IIIC family phosphatase [bacterium]|nr:HAD-IIIC family phosphatase [bacterium]